MRADAVAKRQALVAAARELVAASGPDVPLSQVAARADVGIATLYRHFPTRADLLVGIAESVRDALVQVTDRAVAAFDAEGADPDEVWAQFAAQVAALQPGAILPQLAQGHRAHSLPAELSAVRSTVLGALERVVDRAKTAGLVREDVPAVRFQLAISAITRPFPDIGVHELADQQQWHLAALLRGLRP